MSHYLVFAIFVYIFTLSYYLKDDRTTIDIFIILTQQSDLVSFQPVLAQVWSLADYDKDGKLSADEFCVAMHLIDMAKSGETLPATLPMELLPYRRKLSLSQASSNGGGAADAPLNVSGNAGDLRSLGISQVMTHCLLA